MKMATISETKNNLSRLLEEVRRGETILLMDRRVPVARIEPYRAATGPDEEGLATLVSKGIVAPPERELDVAAFLASRGPRLPHGISAVRTLLAEREDSP